MRTLVIAQDKTTLKAIGKVLRKAKVEYVVARKIEGAEDTIREKEISLVIIKSLADQNKSNREKQIRNFLYKLMFEELFPQIIILTKTPLPEEYIPLEKCSYVESFIQLKSKISRIKQ